MRAARPVRPWPDRVVQTPERKGDRGPPVTLFSGGTNVIGRSREEFVVRQLGVEVADLWCNTFRASASDVPEDEPQWRHFVAALNGSALGLGAEFAWANDLRVMANGDFVIGRPEVLLGIMPSRAGTQRLTRLIGMHQSLVAIHEGKPSTPDQALANTSAGPSISRAGRDGASTTRIWPTSGRPTTPTCTPRLPCRRHRQRTRPTRHRRVPASPTTPQ